jgi:hypothetical protein
MITRTVTADVQNLFTSNTFALSGDPTPENCLNTEGVNGTRQRILAAANGSTRDKTVTKPGLGNCRVRPRGAGWLRSPVPAWLA